jgi:hypothetical protein
MTVRLMRPVRRDPLHDWRVRAGTTLSNLADAIEVNVPPLAGREDLLQQFDRLLPNSAALRTSVFALTGEPGIGKTRLLQSFIERGHSRGLDIAWAGAVLHGVGVGPRRAGPRVVLGDGVAEARDLLCSLELSNGDAAPGRLLVVAYTPSEAEGPAGSSLHRALAAAARQGALVEATVPPLSDPELAELTTHMLGAPPEPALLHVLSSLSEGNPYLAIQTLQDMARSGAMSQHGAAWQLRAQPRLDFVPAAVSSMARHTIGLLDAATKTTLATAAALGPGFEFELLTAICKLRDDEVLHHRDRSPARADPRGSGAA